MRQSRFTRALGYVLHTAGHVLGLFLGPIAIFAPIAVTGMVLIGSGAVALVAAVSKNLDAAGFIGELHSLASLQLSNILGGAALMIFGGLAALVLGRCLAIPGIRMLGNRPSRHFRNTTVQWFGTMLVVGGNLLRQTLYLLAMLAVLVTGVTLAATVLFVLFANGIGADIMPGRGWVDVLTGQQPEAYSALADLVAPVALGVLVFYGCGWLMTVGKRLDPSIDRENNSSTSRTLSDHDEPLDTSIAGPAEQP